jgi:hypothetical protein
MVRCESERKEKKVERAPSRSQASIGASQGHEWGALANRKGESRWKEDRIRTKGLCEAKQGGAKKRKKKCTVYVKLS